MVLHGKKLALLVHLQQLPAEDHWHNKKGGGHGLHLKAAIKQ
jgi:hypothetical protein